MSGEMMPQIILIVGKSNSGKTTLMEKLIRELSRRGYRVGSAKHTHDKFDFDKEGKDSWRHKNAGAKSSLVITETRVALVKEDSRPPRDRFFDYLGDMDIILAEGFKTLSLPKIEVFRKDGPHKTPLCLEDPELVAFVTDTDISPPKPLFGLDETVLLSDLIESRYLSGRLSTAGPL